MKRVALISGVGGMDGSHLADLLLGLGWEVHGIVRRSSTPNTSRLSHIYSKLILHEGDITDLGSLVNLMKDIQPEWIFNLAAQSHVGSSFAMPAYTLQVTGMGAINMMEAMSQACPHAKLYQASSSEMFGTTDTPTQNENTVLKPISPYGIAKTMAHQMAKIYRADGLFVSCGILFNHESQRRGENFLTKKVAKAVARQTPIKLGNLSAIRDWGYAPEYVEAMVRVMEHHSPDDFVIGTGEAHSVLDFVRTAYAGDGLNWEDYVTIDKSLYRLVEAGPLVADFTKAKRELGWCPKVRFHQLVHLMVTWEDMQM